jgi:hypothetical protein
VLLEEKDKNRTFMQRLIDFSPSTIKKLCCAPTYGSSSKMSQIFLVFAFLAVFTQHVSSEYPGKSKNMVPFGKFSIQRRKNFPS